MSIRMGLAIIACVGAIIGLTAGADAEMAAPTKTPAAKPKTVTVLGCPTKGFPDSCTIIQGGGSWYNVSGANPPVPAGNLVRLKGTVTDKHSFCGGITLDNIRWVKVASHCFVKGTK